MTARIAFVGCFLAVLASTFYFSGGVAQTAQTGSAAAAPSSDSSLPPTPPLPNDPKSRLALLESLNGLDLSGAQAWHIKLTYDHFDSDGDNDSSGIYEEWWAGPRKYKRIYASETFNQVEIATERGLFRSGNPQWPSLAETQVREELVEPLYRTTITREKTKLDDLDWRIGSLKLPCVVFRRTDITISDNALPKYCSEPGTGLLRYTRGRGWDETAYNKIVLFHGRYVAKEVQVMQAGRKYLDIKLQMLETLPQISDADFSPPVDAIGPLGDGIEVPSHIMQDYIVKNAVFSGFPRGARGQVRVELVVGRDGRVKTAAAISGPPELEKTAIGAARKMEFRPFLILGNPVEVKTDWGFAVQ